jgi:peptidoglycan/xylan/chitin deacetylase (PgdA/CDA1 family)
LEKFVSIVIGSLERLVTGIGVLVYYCGLSDFVINAFCKAPRVVMYHACQEREDDFIRGLSINTAPGHLAGQLDFLQKHYRVVPLESLTDGALPDRAAVITFDDGFRSVHDNALPLLRARKLPATCYLVTEVIGGGSLIWVVELNWYLRRHGRIARRLVGSRFGGTRFTSIRGIIQRVIKQYDQQKITELIAELRDKVGRPPDEFTGGQRLFLDRAAIDEMAQHGFTFGSHSASHAVLPRLNDAERRAEIERARGVLDELPGAINSLAYPFGTSDDATRRLAIDRGYKTLMEVAGDNEPFDCLQIARLNVTSVSPAVLFAQLEVTARIKARVKRLIRRVRGAPKPQSA